jgi:hypothetical protein
MKRFQTGSALPTSARLPNASVGKPYRQEVLPLFGENQGRIANLSLELSADCGLSIETPAGLIEGIPSKPGDFLLLLTYRLSDASAESVAWIDQLSLTVNPDPDSLWNDLPSDPAGPFAKQDTQVASLHTPLASIIGASLRGRSHAHTGKYREDDFAMGCTESGWYVLVAADGAGSASYSREGSRLACTTALPALRDAIASVTDLDAAFSEESPFSSDSMEYVRHLAARIFFHAAQQALQALEQVASSSKFSLRDLATTLIVVLARRANTSWFTIGFSVGDGGALAISADGSFKALTHADSGEYSGQTRFLTTPGVVDDWQSVLERTRVNVFSDLLTIAVMTDGVSDPLFDTDLDSLNDRAGRSLIDALGPVLDLRAPSVGAEISLLEWLGFRSPGSHDDRTLLLLCPKR